MSSADRVVKNTGILYAKMGLTVFISLYTTRLILASLGVNDFGIFNLVGGAIAMLTFLNSAMAAATQRFMSFSQGAQDFGKQRSIFNVSIVLHLIIAIVVVIILEVVGYYLFEGVFKIPSDRIDSAKMVFQFMVASTAFTIISVPYDAVINAHENMLLYSVLGVLESILKLVIAIYLLRSPFDRLITYGFLMATLSVLLLIIRRVYCHRSYRECRISLSKYFSKPIFKELTSFASWSLLGASSSMISNYGQGIVMNTFFGPIVNTAQGVANQVSGQLGVFAVTMQKALNPVIDKSEGAGDRSLMLRASLMGSKVSFFLLMLFYVPVLVEMPYIFNLWLKQVPEYTIIFCRLLLIRNLVDQLFITLGASIAAVGNIRQFQIYNSILNFMPLLLGYILFLFGFPPYTLYIIFILYAICSAVMLLYFAKVNCGLSVSDYLKNVVLRCLIVLLLTSLISVCPSLILDMGVLRLSIVIIVSGTAFLGFVWILGFTDIEKTQIRRLVESLILKVRSRWVNRKVR
jgi:O-antigen/teichoic acid export membrane protein